MDIDQWINKQFGTGKTAEDAEEIKKNKPVIEDYSDTVGNKIPAKLLLDGYKLAYDQGERTVLIGQCEEPEHTHFTIIIRTAHGMTGIEAETAQEALALMPFDYSQFRYGTIMQFQQFREDLAAYQGVDLNELQAAQRESDAAEALYRMIMKNLTGGYEGEE